VEHGQKLDGFSSSSVRFGQSTKLDLSEAAIFQIQRRTTLTMNACLFLTFGFVDNVPIDERAKLDLLLRATPRLTRAQVHTPSSASHPYIEEGPPPALVLQLYFPDLFALEATLSRNGHLHALNSRTEFPILASAKIAEQAMLVRPFAVPELSPKCEEPSCTYLVSYEGEADDLNAWHAHYLESHTHRVSMLPGLRELEVYTRLDWVSALPWVRLNYMQRNNVAFDSAEAFEAALRSPVRQAIRADFKGFPPFTGPNRHHAMATHSIRP
jgi:uncharacterized protein (TIGR02118 family)